MLDFCPEIFEKTADVPTRYIDIQISVREVGQVAAMLREGAEIPSEMPADWPSHGRMTNAEWKMYRNVVAEAVTIISSFGFENVKPEFWDAGSCYVNFRPVDQNGNTYGEVVQARFRISEHDSPTGVDYWNDGYLFMMFKINGYAHDTVEGFLNSLSGICGDLLEKKFENLPRV